MNRSTDRAASRPSTARASRTARTARTDQLIEPKQERAVLTRARILQAAAEIFAEHGYPRTSLADVAARVNMTKGAVYFHFKDKDDLAIAVVETFYTRWPAALEEVRAKNLDPLSTVIELMDRTEREFFGDVMVQAAARLQSERSLINSDLPLPYQDWIDRLAILLAAAQEQGQVRTDLSAADLARTLISAFFGMQHISSVLHDRKDQAKRWADTKLLLFAGLRPQSA
ncbi:ScbR family autoregulator-binding transcription factor [Kitasatospora sp. NPDC088134]|uniref:ScbR family autoregulator-binding transcription factor n=1 Tax=Kitasatospora sp. NPDC088134 TaxID=3364071 RepID=UPI0038068576